MNKTLNFNQNISLPFKSKLTQALIAAAVSSSLFISACSKSQAQPEIITTKAQKTTVAPKIEASGTFKAKNSVIVSGQASGQIKDISVEIGDFVKKDQLLLAIDPFDTQNGLSGTMAQITQAKEQLKNKQIQQEILQKKIDLQKKTIELGGAQASSILDLENSLSVLRSDIASTLSSLTQYELAYSKTKKQLGFVNVKSPISGTVVAINVSAGQSINSAQSSPSLLTVADTSDLVLRLELSETDVSKLSLKEPANVEFYLLGSTKKYNAKLLKIDPAPQYVSDNTTLSANSAIYYYGQVLVPNKENLFKIGMSAKASIYLEGASSVLSVPSVAVTKKGEKSEVELKSGVKKEVITGVSDGTMTEIKSGLEEGDEVVLVKKSASITKSSGGPGGPGGPGG